MLGKIAVGVVLGALVIYGGLEALPLIQGPSITLEAPREGETVPGGIVEIRGVVKRAGTFTLNGSPVLPDEEGVFMSTLAYASGTSILTFAAKDRFGRTITLTRTIYIP